MSCSRTVKASVSFQPEIHFSSVLLVFTRTLALSLLVLLLLAALVASTLAWLRLLV